MDDNNLDVLAFVDTVGTVFGIGKKVFEALLIIDRVGIKNIRFHR